MPGEDHASFLKRFEYVIPPRELGLLDFAYDMAKYGHRDQFRESGERYFEHVRATALIVVDELEIKDWEIVAASLLHDMNEDSHLLTPERIKLIFGDRVENITTLVTKPKPEDPRFESKTERLEWYFKRIVDGPWEAQVVKLADRIHNTRTLGSCSVEKQRRKREETLTFVDPVIVSLKLKHPKLAAKLGSLLGQALEPFMRLK